ncbi:[protein-PII] uridylyltransferase family protein [Ovoidimarina sediminis]|uniref:[protein-PII] uridylyltransferase family protein n=1 Tax=Ovoidimarina sediminis TaxID=3079856 RepID=UPI00290751E1|nr:glutamine-synthetase adenylyltransferase [Rhodophyticola sp. MJ-SS7]MDU8945353.1 glutamine-synthetase adenylyltransferase [Rhodophyticola sp. MJ-SS7]
MSFASRITRVPFAVQPDRGQEVRARFSDVAPEIGDLIEGTAGTSPYLAGLIEREADWLEEALDMGAEAARDAVLDGIVVEAEHATDPGAALRAAKRRIALLAALADLGGVWPLETVTAALTELADRATHRALTFGVGAEIRRGKLPSIAPEDAAIGAGLVALAMGKMGAHELNYSSDIDLIVLFDETKFSDDDVAEVRPVLIRATRRMTALLGDVTSEGYVFRTDLRLRPDPGVMPVCLSMEAAERYYESVGRTWERAAYIKARACAGDIAAGEKFLERLTPFVWRRHLDYAAIQDAHDMRLKIREHKAPARRALEGFNVKLGPGGIREIEFYTQTRQIIAGGRDPGLRQRGTEEALRALEAKGWTGEAEILISDYRAHREVEHRLQMLNDQQTHDLPATAEGFDRLAAFMGRESAGLRSEIRERLDRVHRITEGFFAPGTAKDAPEVSASMSEVVGRWPSYPALRSARAAEIFARVRPEILSRLERAARPEEALNHIDSFLKGLPAGVQLFSLFDANPQLIDLIVDIAATSPALAEYLSRHSDVLDAVIGGGFFAEWPGERVLAADLSKRLAVEGDYEARLLAARRWRNDWHFRIGVHHLRGLIDGRDAGAQYADLAGAVLAALWPVVVDEFSRKHGAPPGRGATILGMGSLGSSALTSSSDLDIIVIYDDAGVESSEGRRPLPARMYYARLTQAFVTALTAQMGPGRLYEADMRLRPSGRQGPVATSLAGFKTYQETDAWTWEHLALTRARAVAGSPEIGAEVEAFRVSLLSLERSAAKVMADVAEMRGRLAAARPGSSWDAKSGRGRLQDISLLAQAGALLSGAGVRGVQDQILEGANALGLEEREAQRLCDAYALFWCIQAAQRLMTSDAFDPDEVGQGGRSFLLRETQAADMAALEQAAAGAAAQAGDIIDRVLATFGENGRGAQQGCD